MTRSELYSEISRRVARIRRLLPAGVILVAVTKKFPAEAVSLGYQAGLVHFGENYVQEAKMKISKVKVRAEDPFVWHMIGHLQTNKVKKAVKLFDWIDSVDSLKLAKKISRAAQTQNKGINILLEVNLSGEASKFGFNLANWQKDKAKYQKFSETVREILKLPNLKLRGLMTMPPTVGNPENNRPIFQQMRQLLSALNKEFPAAHFHELSMGTSHDFKVALSEGATMVRLGESLFGPRPG